MRSSHQLIQVSNNDILPSSTCPICHHPCISLIFEEAASLVVANLHSSHRLMCCYWLSFFTHCLACLCKLCFQWNKHVRSLPSMIFLGPPLKTILTADQFAPASSAMNPWKFAAWYPQCCIVLLIICQNKTWLFVSSSFISHVAIVKSSWTLPKWEEFWITGSNNHNQLEEKVSSITLGYKHGKPW